MASEPDVIRRTLIAVALVWLLASVGCAGLGAGTEPLRISDIADQGDAERRASQQLVLDGLDSDINLLPDVALRQYETAIQVDPTNPYGYLAIARHHVDSEDPRRALPFLDQSEALLRAQGEYSPRVEAHLMGLRGEALYTIGEREQGFPMLQRARDLAPSVWDDGHLSAVELR